MSANTIAVNKLMDKFDQRGNVWLFGYGSLIFKADFPYNDRQPASIQDWQRRFWQGSHDHRGTEDNPGRVVTLISSPDSQCQGMAYLISTEVFDHLDFREKNGYLRFSTQMQFNNGDNAEGLVYIATEENDAFLGPATEEEIAQHIFNSSGPSGSNRDYLLELADALRQLSAEDSHVFSIEQHLLELMDQN